MADVGAQELGGGRVDQPAKTVRTPAGRPWSQSWTLQPRPRWWTAALASLLVPATTTGRSEQHRVQSPQARSIRRTPRRTLKFLLPPLSLPPSPSLIFRSWERRRPSGGRQRGLDRGLGLVEALDGVAGAARDHQRDSGAQRLATVPDCVGELDRGLLIVAVNLCSALEFGLQCPRPRAAYFFNSGAAPAWIILPRVVA